MKSMLLAGTALLSACLATGAQAATNGWYGAVDLGYNWPSNIGTTSATPAGGSQAETWKLFGNGMGDVRIGYKALDHLRIEGEFGYRSNPLYKLSIPGSGPIQVSGQDSDFTAMANVIYDFDKFAVPMTSGSITPFVGVGAGIDDIGIKARGSQVLAPNTAITTTGGQRVVGAAQALAGVSYTIAPQWDVDLTYRYRDTFDTYHFAGQMVTGPAVVPGTPYNRSFDRALYQESSLTIGIRYSFAPPPAPPPPPPREEERMREER